MPRGENQKLKLFYLYKIMLELTDEEHGLTVQEIIAELSKCGVEAERKSIYRDFEVLRDEMDIEIIKVQEGRQFYYHVGSKQFEIAELKLLVDAVQSSNFITERKSSALIKKLTGFVSKYEATQLKRQVQVQGRIKNMNESIYYSVDEIYNAIAGNVAIKFKYLQWNTDKKLVPKRKSDSDEEKIYLVSPWSLLWNDERYYLVAYDHDLKEIRHYRVDKMDKIELLDIKREGREEYLKEDPAQYAKKNFGMFHGKEMDVRVEFPEDKAGIFLDQFGKDIPIVPSKKKGFFTTTITVYVSSHFYGWIMALGKGVRIIGPDAAVKEYKKQLQEQIANY